jgi:hypothetical protein
MAPCICAYCGVAAFGHHMVEDLYGIIACDAHSEDAARDICAWMHRNGQVQLITAKTLDGIKPFFDALPASFSIRRSSGAIDGGWSLPTGYSAVWARMKRVAGLWAIPVEKMEANGDKWSRYACLSAFLEQDVAVPGITVEVVAAATVVLDSGVYKADWEAATASVAVAGVAQVAASAETNSAGTPLVVPMVVHGVACRVVDHDGEVADLANAGKLPEGFAIASFA